MQLCVKNRIKNIQSLLTKDNLKIAIWGFGLTGRSFLEWCKKNISKNTTYFIFDKKNLTSDDPHVFHFLEEKREEYDEYVDVILPSPGIIIERKKELFEKIIPELDLLFYILSKRKIKTVLITGSIGKSSLTTMIEWSLKKISPTVLCGNIGFPTLYFLNNEVLKDYPIFCIEASDAQLKHCCLVTPTIFIITNLYQNHLNYHKSYKEYVKAKLTPLFYQEKKIKKIILSEQAYNEISLFYSLVKCYQKTYLISDEEIKKTPFIKNKIVLKNNHIYCKNKILVSQIPSLSFQKNWAMVVAVLLVMGKEKSVIAKYLDNDIALPRYRLEKILEKNNIIIFNDSKSTIIESTVSAIENLKTIYHDVYFVIMIGGLSKGVNRIPVINKIMMGKNTQLILFGAEASNIIANIVQSKNVICESDFSLAVKKALLISQNRNKKTIILFSPGGSSFDQFSSFEDRGARFNKCINDFVGNWFLEVYDIAVEQIYIQN